MTNYGMTGQDPAIQFKINIQMTADDKTQISSKSTHLFRIISFPSTNKVKNMFELRKYVTQVVSITVIYIQCNHFKISKSICNLKLVRFNHVYFRFKLFCFHRTTRTRSMLFDFGGQQKLHIPMN